MLLVVLDTNEVGVHRPLASAGHRLLIEAARAGTIRLVVPQLVIDEVVNKWRENLEDAVERRAKAERQLVALQAITPAKQAPILDSEELAHAVRNQLVELLASVDADMPDLPAVKHEELVARSLRRRQPFDSKGHNGYRDTLLWETVLELLREGHHVALVSNDIDAFQEKRTRGELSRELAAEAEPLGPTPNALQLFHNVRDAAEALVGGTDQGLEHVERLLADEEFAADLRGELERAATNRELSEQELAGLSFNVRVLDAETGWDAALTDVRIGFAREVGDHDLVVDGVAMLLLDVTVRFNAGDYPDLAATEDVWTIDLDEDDQIARAQLSRRATMPFEAVIDLKEESVVSIRPAEFERVEP